MARRCFFNGAGFDGEMYYETALRARIIKGWSVYEIQLLSEGNKNGKTIRICDSSDSRVLQKGSSIPNREFSLPVKSFQDLESDSITVEQPVIKLCNENGELRLSVCNTYAVSIDKPLKQTNSYIVQGHQLHKSSSGKYEADKANMLQVNFRNQESASKFYDTFQEMAGFEGIKKTYGHDGSVPHVKMITSKNRQKNPPKTYFHNKESPTVKHDQEDAKSSSYSPEVTLIENLRHSREREPEGPTKFVDRYRGRSSELPTKFGGRYRGRSSEFYPGSKTSRLTATRSSMDGVGSYASVSSLDPTPRSPATDNKLMNEKSTNCGFASSGHLLSISEACPSEEVWSTATPPTHASNSSLDPNPQSPTDYIWEDEESTNRGFTYAVTKKENDDNSNDKNDNRCILSNLL